MNRGTLRSFMECRNADVDPTDLPPTDLPGGGGGGSVDPTPPAVDPTPPAADQDPLDTESWKASLPEDLKESKLLSRVKSVGDLAQNYIESQKFISGAVKIPDKNADKDVVDKFYEKLGVPATSDEYEFEIPEVYKDAQVTVDEGGLSNFKSIAKECNLTKDQAQKVVEGYMDIETKRAQEAADKANADYAESLQELQKEWRGSYQEKVDRVNANLARIFPGDSLEKAKSAGLLRDASFIKSLYGLTNMLTGDTLYIEGQPVTDVTNTIEAKEAKIQSMRDNGTYGTTEGQKAVGRLFEEIAMLKQAQRKQGSRG